MLNISSGNSVEGMLNPISLILEARALREFFLCPAVSVYSTWSLIRKPASLRRAHRTVHELPPELQLLNCESDTGELVVSIGWCSIR